MEIDLIKKVLSSMGKHERKAFGENKTGGLIFDCQFNADVLYRSKVIVANLIEQVNIFRVKGMPPLRVELRFAASIGHCTGPLYDGGIPIHFTGKFQHCHKV